MNTLDNLLRRLTKTSKEGNPQPCRICGNLTEATDLCDQCIEEEVEACCGDEDGQALVSAMLSIRACNKKLDIIEAGIEEMKNARS